MFETLSRHQKQIYTRGGSRWRIPKRALLTVNQYMGVLRYLLSRWCKFLFLNGPSLEEAFFEDGDALRVRVGVAEEDFSRLFSLVGRV